MQLLNKNVVVFGWLFNIILDDLLMARRDEFVSSWSVIRSMAKQIYGVSFQPFIAGLSVEVLIQLLGHSNRFLALSVYFTLTLKVT
jgi:hypothetical protein